MSQAYDSIPLVGLDAVVLDTETTGLDPKRARIVEIGGIGLEKGRLNNDVVLEILVAPGSPIPHTATQIHGIKDSDLAGAPTFKDVAPRLAGFLQSFVLIGHNTGFDLAMLAREHALAGLPWQAPRSLDVGLLARAAAPSLASYSVDALADWLSVDVTRRHRALGDAMATAGIFIALVPHLRAAGIRTLAEAEAASRRFDAERSTSTAAGWAELSPPGQREQATLRIDSYPYRHRVADVMASPVVAVAGTSNTSEVLRVLLDKSISSVIVETADGRTGLVTERDLLRAVMRERDSGTAQPVADYMSAPLQTVSADDFIYRAIARMDRLKLRHLPVRDDSGAIVGMVTPRNLLRQRASAALTLRDSLDQASTVEDLARNWSRLPEVAESLRQEAVDARRVASIISGELCAMTARAAQIAEARLVSEGLGAPPVAYTVLVLGSGGRGESLLAADQDNAVVYAAGEPDGPADQYFAKLGQHFAEILDVIGIPLCKGGVMARNAAWRHSREGWHAVIESWVRRSAPKDLLDIDIFFDGIPVHGDGELAESILADAHRAARTNPQFLLLLAELARDWHAPVTLFGKLRTEEDGRVDLKKGGLMPIFTAARILAIKHEIRARSTRERLEAARALKIGSTDDIEAAIAAHGILLDTILDQQLVDIAAGKTPGSRVDAQRLSKTDAKSVKSALAAIPGLLGVLSEGRL
ncbi:MAG: DUF294 nucleotidyltransferase-like domain-containing protein [Hyphomicrobiaceae bacterium]